MVKNRVSLRKFIRFQLEQMTPANEHHRFEQLAFELARLRIASNILPATGPVQAGGDQGRDFESFRTYIARTTLSGSVFAAKVDTKLLAFACTLNKQISGKIKSDLATVCSGDQKPATVYYVCSSDVSITTRHNLQKYFRETFNTELEIIDGQAVSDMLCDPDTFWIAEEYLSVPAEMFPPVEVDEEYQQLKDRWLDGEERHIINSADFLEVKRGLRRATFNEAAKVDLSRWMVLMRRAEEQPRVRRKAIYEVAVAQLRGRGSLSPERLKVAHYFSSLQADASLEDIEDAVYLASYCNTAIRMGHFDEESAVVAGWTSNVAEAVETRLAAEPGRSDKFRLLSAKAHLQFQAGTGSDNPLANIEASLATWHEAISIAEQDPLSDASSIADLLEILAPLCGQLQQFQALADRVDAVVSKREGAAAGALLARGRAKALQDSGHLVLAIDQLQRAKVGWFASETMRGSVIATLMLANLYQDLNLYYAARYYAMIALFVSLRVHDDPKMPALMVEAGFEVADTFYVAGEVLSYLCCLRPIIGVHGANSIDPGDTERNENLLRAILHAGVSVATLSKVAPEAASVAIAIISAWPVDDEYKELIGRAPNDPPWSDWTLDDLYRSMEEQVGQNPTNDLGEFLRISWFALGVRWTVNAPRKLQSVADSFCAVLQVTQVDLADLELLVVESAVELTLDEGGDWDVSPARSNDLLSWRVAVPHDMGTAEGLSGEMFRILGLTMMVLREVSALPDAQFHEVFENRVKRGLLNRASWVRTPRDMMAEARKLATPDGIAFPPLPSVQRLITPLRAAELNDENSDPPQYSKAKSLEMIGNRYRRLAAFGRWIAPLLRQNERAWASLTKLHQEGFSDWKILGILFNLALQQRTESLIGGPVLGCTIEVANPIMEREARLLQQGQEFAFDPSALTEEALEIQRRLFTMAQLSSWQLIVPRQTPNISAVEHLLDHRFHQDTDDIPHEDFFGWNT